MHLRLLTACLVIATNWYFATASHSQQTATGTRLYVVSPVVGEVIDRQEKARFGLFPYYAADNFEEARFEQALTPDSLVTLHTQLRDGRTVVRPFTAAELSAVRTTIETRARELDEAAQANPASVALPDSVGRRFRVTLRQGAAFDGELTARQPTQLEFRTEDLGIVQVKRADIRRLEELTSALAKRPANWFDIGNGNRLFFQPTARNLRRGEGSLQDISLYILGGNYGITDNVSMGLLVSLVPGVPLSEQLVAFTPKFSAQLSDKLYAGGGLLYLRVADIGAGVVYGNITAGTADDNLTLGLGYGFINGDVGSTPVIQLGGQKRLSRRVSFISENYILANSDAGLGGLYGVKINWRRTNLGLAAAYVASYTANAVFSSYIIPVYIDFTFRFGRPAR